MDKGNIAGRQARFNQQMVIARHNFHQFAVGWDHAAQSIDLDFFDNTFHRRAHRHTRDAVGTATNNLGQRSRLGGGFSQFFASLNQVLRTQVENFELKIGTLALKTEHFHVAGRTGFRQATGYRQFTIHRRQ